MRSNTSAAAAIAVPAASKYWTAGCPTTISRWRLSRTAKFCRVAVGVNEDIKVDCRVRMSEPDLFDVSLFDEQE